MKHLNYNKKNSNNTISTVGAAAVLFALTFFIVASAGVSAAALGNFEDPPTRNSPSVVSGDNIYIAWWTNNTENGNEEVMFRASNDGGATFGDKINLSNSSEADSWRVEIAGEGETVVVSWWETNETSDTPVARISTDAGETFGPLMMLAANGTLGSGEAEEIAVAGEGGETVEE